MRGAMKLIPRRVHTLRVAGDALRFVTLGRIAWSRFEPQAREKWEYGLEFLELPSKTQSEIRSYLGPGT